KQEAASGGGNTAPASSSCGQMGRDYPARIQDAETIFGPRTKQTAGEPLDGVSACSAGTCLPAVPCR
ncbi:MAG TPA: hypothetical protein VNO18_14575, partial [Xanthobacteraceae bacterium]|nr:hypothetical protein [Xanthobacteraceae bacterium]